MKKNIFIAIFIAISPGFPLNAMKKAAGALEVAGGASAAISNGIVAAKIIAGGASLASFAASVPLGIAAIGTTAVVKGIEKLCSEGNIKVEAGEVLIQYKDPATGKARWIKYSGSDVDKFLKKNGFIISWRGSYPVQEESQKVLQDINNEIKALQRQYGRPKLYNNIVTINNPELRDAHAQVVENPVGIDALANELAQKEKLFAGLRRAAIHSYGTPDDKDNLALFAKPASQAMATLIHVTSSAYTYPYEELVRNERAAKEAAQAQVNEQQRLANANAASLRNLVANKDNLLKALRRELAKPRKNGQFVQLQQQNLQAELEGAINNTSANNLQLIRDRMQRAEFNDLFELMRLKALVPNNDPKTFFIEVLADEWLAAFNAYTLPLREENNQSQNEKEALRREKDGIIAQRDATIAEKETLANNHLQSYNLSVRREHGLRDDLAAERARAELIEADRDQIETDFTALLNLSDTTAEIYKKRITGLMAVEEENARLRAQLEALRKQTLDQGSKAADEYTNLRRELSPLRRERDQLKAQLQNEQKAIDHAKQCPILRVAEQD